MENLSRIIKERREQMHIDEFIDGMFLCKVSNKFYKNRADHKNKCIYKYCKSGWDW